VLLFRWRAEARHYLFVGRRTARLKACSSTPSPAPAKRLRATALSTSKSRCAQD